MGGIVVGWMTDIAWELCYSSSSYGILDSAVVMVIDMINVPEL